MRLFPLVFAGWLVVHPPLSVGGWSIGSDKTETSILNAYMHAISSAQHFIYIGEAHLDALIPDAHTYLLGTDTKLFCDLFFRDVAVVVVVAPTENQFFVSSTAGNPVRNDIAIAIFQRIKQV